MSVLSCDRAGCENVMCDCLLENWYVCNECLEEFRQVVGAKMAYQRSELVSRLKAFLEEAKPPKICEHPLDVVTVEDFIQAGYRE